MDVMKLNGISKRAFESDTLVRAASPGEPPGYMSMSFHIFRNVGDESINKEQLDLYLISRNIGTLWFCIGKTQEKPFDDMEFVIMFSVRKISDDSKYRKRLL